MSYMYRVLVKQLFWKIYFGNEQNWTVTVCFRGSGTGICLKLFLKIGICTSNEKQTERKQMLGVFNL